MGVARRLLVGAAPGLLLGAALAVIPPTPAGADSVSRSLTCRYVNQTDDPAPVRLGPGKKYRKAAELPPSGEPVKATCAARGRGPEHWVRIKDGEQKGRWVWRNRLQAWNGE
ncbi:hypothetical protein ACU635_20635 [[Actinomadura] parvosata]|uniref:hypothetical protein n=1 Tax=[Actinomadura] parvosata TaxID=1955412 RepID=UPI00406C28AC